MIIGNFFLFAHDDNEGEKTQTTMSKEEEEKMAELGKPRLGEITKISCHIRESMEFKVGIDLVFFFSY